ncbi:MAG: hypothetical protein AB1503_11680 [Bacillota bacterium]
MWLVVLAVAVSLDGMWAGLAQGLRGRRATAWQLAAVGAESATGSALAMAAGVAFAGSLGEKVASWLAAAVFLGIALWNFGEALGHHHPAGRSPVPRPDVPGEQATCPDLRGAVSADHPHLDQAASRDGPNPAGDRPVCDCHPDRSVAPLEWSLVLLMGASVAIDASLAACGLAMGGYRSLFIPPLFGLSHIILVGVGNTLGCRAAAGIHPPTRALLAHPGRAQPPALSTTRTTPAVVSATLTSTPPWGGKAAAVAGRLALRVAPGLIFLLLGLLRLTHALAG